MTASYPSVV